MIYILTRKESQEEFTDKWIWVRSKGEIFLQNKLLRDEGFKHGFFTKKSGNRAPKELIKSLNERASVHMVKQIHQSKILEASEANQDPWPRADGLIGTKKGQSLWVYSADCIPILFGDPTSGFFAANHAGWRGVSEGIPFKTISQLENRGADIDKLIVIMGPAISGSKYQVGIDIVETIYKSFNNNANKINEILDHMINLNIITLDKPPGKFLLDIRFAAMQQLYSHGIKKKQIQICPYCTFSDHSLFNSWRRDKVKKIQWSGITC